MLRLIIGKAGAGKTAAVFEEIRRAVEARQGGRILLSGFYENDIPMLLEKAASLGLRETARRTRDDWALLVLKK